MIGLSFARALSLRRTAREGRQVRWIWLLGHTNFELDNVGVRMETAFRMGSNSTVREITALKVIHRVLVNSPYPNGSDLFG